MKISFVLVCTCAMLTIKKAHGSAIGTPFYPLDPEDLSDGEIKEVEYLEKYFHRPKRTLLPPDPISGSAGFISHLKTASILGTKDKIGGLAKGSAGLITGAAAAASIGTKDAVVNVGKGIGGAIAGSAAGINHLKTALLTEATKKIVGASTGAVTGSASAIKHLKTAALTGIGLIASGSAKSVGSASTGILQASGDAKNAVKHIKTSALLGIAKTVGALASGSAKAVGSASTGLGQASAGTVKNIKTSVITGITSKIGKIASGSAGAAVGLATAGSTSSTKALKGSADIIFQIKSAIIAGLTKHLGLIAAGSAKTATGASLGITKKITQVSGDVATGTVDVINQLKHAAIAGTKKKLGQAASGLAGAITGAVGSASAGAGELARSAFFGTANLVTQLKTAVVVKTTDKIGQIASGSAGLVAGGSKAVAHGVTGAFLGSVGSASSAVKHVKTAALAGVAKTVGSVASASVGAVTGAAGKASAASGQLATGVIKGSVDKINQAKLAAIKGIIGVASLSAGAVAGASGHAAKTAGAAVTGSAKAVHQLKAAVISGTVKKIGALAAGSSGLSKRSVDGEAVEQFLDLPKRAESAWSSGSGHGSADIINQLKSAVVSGLSKKIGQVAKGSAGAVAGASAGFSKGSFGGHSKEYPSHDSGHSYEHDHHDDHEKINIWELKKSVLNTLLQAVKAIKGGVLAIKGQLIKGSGYLVSGGGKLIAASGDKVSSLGKNIIHSAILVPPHKEHYSHSEYSPSGPPSGSYTAPSGPPIVYDSPPHSSGPSYESHYEGHYDHHNDKSPHGPQGIIVLRRIPPTKDKYYPSHSHTEESRVPAFKPLEPTGPSIGTIFGKFLTASTSLDTSQPTSFGDTGPEVAYDSHGEVHYADKKGHYADKEGHNSDKEGHYGVKESHVHLKPPTPSHYEEPRHKVEAAAPPSYQAPLVKEHKAPPVQSNVDFSSSVNHFDNNDHFPSLDPNFGHQFEDNFNFLNINDHLQGEASNINTQTVKLTKGEILDHLEASAPLASSQIQLPKDAPESFNALKNSLKSEKSLGGPFSPEFLNKNTEKSNKKPSSGGFLPKPSTTNYLEGALYPQKVDSFGGTSIDTSLNSSPTYSTFNNSPPKASFSPQLVATKDNSLESFLPKEEPFNSREVLGGFSSAEQYQKYLEQFPFHKVYPSSSSFSRSKTYKSKSPLKLRMQHDHRHRRPSDKGNYSVVRSVSYEITPNGAKRLT